MAKLTGTDAHRDRILKAALTLLTKRGRDAVTTRSVAEAAKVQPPVLYRIFGDKTGVLDAVAAYGFTAYLAKKRRENALYAGLSRGVVAKAKGSEDAFDALVSAMVMVEHRGEFARLRQTVDEVFRMEGQTWVPGLVAG